MIKKLIDKLLGKGPASAAAGGKGVKAKRVEIAREQHGIDLGLVDERAIKVVKTLKDAGFQAYIVGGAVRDLLLGLRPKDFDVATDATPEQVKQQFRRAFIIGRRFRIVHVVFGRGREHEVIEVSTFRALVDASAAEQVEGNEKTSKSELAGKSHVVDASGRVLRDNVWGSQDDDAARRDFTVNAMYYDPLAEVVVDYFHGLADAKKRVLRMIGDAATRYREDPVRVLRAVRFAAKLGFTIEPKTLAPLREGAQLLRNVPASRMFDEMIKLLQTGHAVRSLAELRTHGLVGGGQGHRGIFPILDAVVEAEGKQPERDRFVQLALEDTDRRVGEDKPVAPSFLLACLLWHEVLQRWQKNKARGDAPFPALQDAIDAVFDARVGDISGRGKLGADMREIWSMQPRFERRVGNAPFSLVEQPRFRAGFDFLRLRAAVGEVDESLARWWESFSSTEDEAERRAMIDEARKSEGRKPAGGRVHRVERVRDEAAASNEEGDAPSVDETSAPAKKRRRRRRKPAGTGAATAPQGD
ncbi:polynucleotide adenylyltransferase PcnB [Caldimonas sp. KR1-144]|uniref:polynucleotide adenylyltransferase PcnB n=1 Tax=Caldimonas sp. KR1-144 TaxID=3400911 RepID=UPI003C062BB7